MSILVVSPLPQNGCNWYRGTGVYRYFDDCKSFSPGISGWTDLIGFKALVLVRPDLPESLNLIDFAKTMKIPSIVDFDDDIYNPDLSSPFFQHLQNNPKLVKYSKQCISDADHVTVATQAIKDSFITAIPGLNADKVIIIPNAFNDYEYKIPDIPFLNKKFSMRGDNHGWNDVLTLFNEIKYLSEKYDLTTIGNFQLFIDYFKFEEQYNYLTIPLLNDALLYIKSRILIKPLKYNLFNKSKSNCSWLEATAGGSVVMAPSGFSEFDGKDKIGIVNYEKENFIDEFEKLMNHDQYAITKFQESKEYIMSFLRLSEVNKLRKDLL